MHEQVFSTEQDREIIGSDSDFRITHGGQINEKSIDYSASVHRIHRLESD